ncbi:TPA: fimbria/pilus periplasmic chaperone [Citrobacter amalonaticus]|uniref:Fimbria/pilus periplasmic chaperone n=1 Tax=Citrobacter amalonaticus TaxID=35703 RepID=A0A9C7QKM4_CITAM|nr:fimbria/pilus periplasmic chaperone [Citrobacter amalonaticus]
MFQHSKKQLMSLFLLTATGLTVAQSADAALALDRTRVVLDGGDKSVSLTVTNQNRELPFLAQAWVEDAQGKKLTDPLTALPPVQRIEPGSKTQVKVQTTPAMNLLAQDKETLFYFNLREIPPKTDKPNTLQIALQTRIKLFYRPAGLAVNPSDKPWQEQMTLTRQGDHYVANNPTAYYISIVEVSPSLKGAAIKSFKPVLVAPKSSAPLGSSANEMGNNPVVTYINDFGGRPKLVYRCGGNNCTVQSTQAG